MKKPGWNPKKGLAQQKQKESLPRLDYGQINQESESLIESTDGESYGDNPESNQLTSESEPLSSSPRPDSMDSPVNADSPSDQPAPEPHKGKFVRFPVRNQNQDGGFEEAVDLSVPKIYTRSKWQHVTHWVAFVVILFFDFLVIGVTIRNHLHPLHQITMAMIGKEMIADVLILLMNSLVVPSIIFEANQIEANEHGLILWNLLYKTSIPWTDIKRIKNPIYLKFAIISTPRFFQLLNKRDIRQFEELLHTIRVKSGLTSKK